jgi:hypothetical protein
MNRKEGTDMQVLYARCCGLDVHMKTVIACVMITQANGKVDKSIRTFATTTAALLALVVNTLRSGRIWPANVEHCPQSWTLGQTFLEKLLLIWLLSSMFCK